LALNTRFQNRGHIKHRVMCETIKLFVIPQNFKLWLGSIAEFENFY